MKSKIVKFKKDVVTNLSDTSMENVNGGGGSDPGYGSSFTKNSDTCCFSNCHSTSLGGEYTCQGDSNCVGTTYPYCYS